MKNLFLHKGWYKLSHKKLELFNLTKWVKNLLISYKVALVDHCCPCDSETAPLRWNKTQQYMEYYDCDDKQWKSR